MPTKSVGRTPGASDAYGGPVYGWDELRAALRRPLSLVHPVALHLIRHGETTTNAQGLITGAQDVPLTARGMEQARIAGLQLDPAYDVAFHSTLQRAAQTLRLALESGHVRVGGVFADSRLNERSLGHFELQAWRPLEAYAAGDLHFAPPGGESYAEVARRILSFLLDLRSWAQVARTWKVLIAGHMGPMRILVGILEEQRDPVTVLAQSFRNVEVVKLQWERLLLPDFLEGVAGCQQVGP